MGRFGRRDQNKAGRGSSYRDNRESPQRDSDFGGFRRDFGPREMHKATCSDCGQECEVPFKPAQGRPVYCRDCFQKHKRF